MVFRMKGDGEECGMVSGVCDGGERDGGWRGVRMVVERRAGRK